MNVLKFVICWLILCGYFMLGSWLSERLALPLSGAICGMLLLLISQFFSHRLATWLVAPVQPVLQNMTLFFIPAVLGVAAYSEMIADYWLSLVLAIVGSTIVSLAICALATQYLLSRTDKQGEHE